ncbi:MAG TPA: hypothetical protein VMA13_04775 [Candidatus Saccharimonadales bacterium]|nr:hypothetical protein [Candidatus Saccharimonadales bacterium]
MNVLLWRAEYDSHGIGIRVPPALVWQKILTAPDISSLNVFQDGQRTGFCEFSTSVEQEMATLDESSPVPKGLNTHMGYQIRINGNVSLGDFTNRLTFNGQFEFTRQREWQKLDLKLSSHFATVEIHSLADEQNVHLKITSDGVSTERVFSFDELRNPDKLWRAFAGDLGDDWVAGLDLPIVPQTSTLIARGIHWEANRDLLTIGKEPVPVYRLETRILDRPIIIYVSTLGEILRIELPDDVIASYDQLGTP